MDARVVAPDGTLRRNGEPGEIELRGSNVMQGYHDDAGATARTIRGGWLATGDLGYRDSDGFYFITGRLKELIIKGGENIAPREIDEALLKHPAVLEAAAVGIRPRLRTGNPGVRGAQGGARMLGSRAACALCRRARSIQDAEAIPLRRRAAEGAVGKGAAIEARGRVRREATARKSRSAIAERDGGRGPRRVQRVCMISIERRTE
jgi:acyl-CoA synthetase (AMP-forming)/AMP-acid ligase II